MSTFDQIIEEARALKDGDEFVPALQKFAEAARLDPSRKEPLTELAMLYHERGDVEGSVGFLLKALECDQDDAYIRLNLGLQFFELNRLEEAAQHLKESVLMIQRFVSGIRIDAMFEKSESIELLLRRADELEETGAQALELLAIIAADRVPLAVHHAETREPKNAAANV